MPGSRPRVTLHSCDPWCSWENCADQERQHDHPPGEGGVLWCSVCDRLCSQDPQDAEDRLAHDLPYNATDSDLCRRGCGLTYREIYSGKIGHCPAWPFPPYDADDVPDHAFDAWGAAWGHIGIVFAISWNEWPEHRQLTCCPHADMGRYRDVRLQTIRRLMAQIDLPADLIDLSGPPCINQSYGWGQHHRCGEYWCPRHGAPQPKGQPT